MDSVDLEVMRAAVSWVEAGHGATIGTVTRTWGSAPRPVGAMLVIRDDGHVMGSVSGGCVEDDLIEKVKAHKLAAGKPEVTTYGITNEEATRWGLPCGGTLQLVLEPVTRDSKLEELLEIIERHELVARFLDMDSGAVRLEPGKWSDALEFDGKVAQDGARAAVAAADHRRRPDEPLPRADGDGARLPRHRLRPARGVRRGVEPARRRRSSAATRTTRSCR